MKVIFSRFAAFELENAKHFYDEVLEGGGIRFIEEVERATKRISEFPNAWPVERTDIRKCLLRKFPYKLVYSIRRRSHLNHFNSTSAS